MQSTAIHPPKTLLEVYRMLPEGTRAELINDKLFMSPAPTIKHQNVIFALTGQFYNYINKEKNGEVFVSPVDVYINEKNVVQPDLVFVAKKNLTILKEDGIYGAPDLIIEVLSPGTKKFDLEEKKKIYEKSGVKEYWVVDPDIQNTFCSSKRKRNSRPRFLNAPLSSSHLKITFLGTGTSQGVPVIGCECEVCRSLDYRDKRLRVSVFLEVDGKNLVIDSGPDFRQQMLRERINKLDAVLLTHSHKDHIAGLDDVRAFNFLQREGIKIIPLPVLHFRMPVLGFRVNDFSYITDANFIPEETFEKLKGTKVLVLNALQKESHVSHFTLEEAIVQAKKIGADQTYFTHISHRMGLHQQVTKELPAGMALAHDGLIIDLKI
ncbi:MAG: Uma2 family endonuclease [Bacteroidetes bacterium]|nr:Uma2 family endonuclease [Bacteroidota bacterium]